jgi:hypothetical protein
VPNIAGDQLVNALIEQAGGKQGVGNPFSAELMPMLDREPLLPMR